MNVCPCVKKAREMNSRAVFWQRLRQYQHSEPLFKRRDGLMRAARTRREMLSAGVAS